MSLLKVLGWHSSFFMGTNALESVTRVLEPWRHIVCRIFFFNLKRKPFKTIKMKEQRNKRELFSGSKRRKVPKCL